MSVFGHWLVLSLPAVSGGILFSMMVWPSAGAGSVYNVTSTLDDALALKQSTSTS